MLPLLGLAGLLSACGTNPSDHPAADAVVAFNEAINREDVEGALAHVEPGSVQFNLGPSHQDMGESTELTQDLSSLWRIVSTVLFDRLESYERTVEVIDVRVEGSIGTVWASTRTTTVERGATPSVLEFSELYVLLDTGGGWKIAGIANNRPTTAP